MSDIDLDLEIEFLNNPEALAQRAKQDARKELEDSYKKSTLDLNGVSYDTNFTAQANMASVGAVANWKFNDSLVKQMKLMASNENATDELKQFAEIIISTYQTLYKKTRLDWKGADNKMHDVEVESILEVLHKSLVRKKSIVMKTVNKL